MFPQGSSSLISRIYIKHWTRSALRHNNNKPEENTSHRTGNREQLKHFTLQNTEGIFWRMAIVGIGSHLLCCVTTSKLSIGRGVNIIYHLLSTAWMRGPDTKLLNRFSLGPLPSVTRPPAAVSRGEPHTKRFLHKKYFVQLKTFIKIQ